MAANYSYPTTGSPHDNHVDESCYRVRIFPGPPTPSSSPPPPPPSPFPPKPSHLCKIAVVGDAQVGKSSIVHKFIHRHCANHCHTIDINSHGNERNKFDLGTSLTNNNNGGGGAASYNSMGTSSFQSGGRFYGGGERGEQPTLADYYKKDITIWSEQDDESSSIHEDGAAQQKTNSICIRVQCWDMNIPSQFIRPPPQQQTSTPINELDSYSCNTQSVTSDLPSPMYNTSIAESLRQLIHRVDAIVIVCRCPIPPTTFTTTSSSSQHCFANSSNASYVSHTTDISSSGTGGLVGWPELDALQQQIQSYTSFLREDNHCNNEQSQQEEQTKQNQDKQRRKASIFVLLSCADLAMGEYSPRQYVKLSNRMDNICNQCGVASWRMGTCIDTRNDGFGTIDEMHTQQQQHEKEWQPQPQTQQKSTTLNVLQRMMKQQLHLMEDMEDAIERIFIDMIRSLVVVKEKENKGKSEDQS